MKIFDSMSMEYLSMIYGSLVPFFLGAGEVLQEESSEILSVCFIQKGYIEVFKKKDGKEVIIGTAHRY